MAKKKGKKRGPKPKPKPPAKRKKPPKIEQEVRRAKIGIDYLKRGITSPTELAARHGVHVATIYTDLEELRERLRDENLMGLLEAQRIALARYEDTFRMATDSFLRSQENETTIITREVKEKCSSCGGTGMIGGEENDTEEWCPNCDGRGHNLIEVTETKVKGKPGDPAHLKVRNDCVKKIAELLGLDEKGADIINQNFIQQTNNVINVENVPADALLEARAAVLEVQRLAGAATSAQTIDVEVDDDE